MAKTKDMEAKAQVALAEPVTESTESVVDSVATTESTELTVQSAGETALANMSQDTVYMLADNVPAVRDEGKAVSASFKNRVRCAEVLAIGYAVRHYQIHRDSRPLSQVLTRIKTLSAPVKNALRHILPGAAFIKNGVSFAILFDLESEHIETVTLPDGKTIKRPAIYMAGFNQLMYAARMIAATPSDQWKYIDPVSAEWKKTFPLEKKHESMDIDAWRASIEKSLIKMGVEPSQAKAQAMNAKRVTKAD